MRRFNLFVVFIFAFGFFSSAGAQTYETFTRELMTQLEVHLDHEYYKDIQEKDRQTAFEVLQSFQGKGVSTDHPKLVLTAGAMTSGKTTAFQIFEKAGLVDRNKIIFIDPDEMKNLIPGYLDRVKNHDATAGSNYHLLSMYIGDILLGWAFLQQKSAVYMTSLRYLPSAQLLIDRVRKDHPKYETTIVYVRSPVSTLMDRNLKRHEQIGRFIPEALLMQSVPEVEHSVWDLEPRVNRFLLVVNDENRPLRISYLRKASQIVSTDIAFPDSEPVLKNDEHLKLLSNFLGGSPNSDESALNMNEPDDVFLDIDWTSVYSVRGPHQEDFIHYDKTLYRPTDGLAEFVSALLDIPGVRLSFISGGDRHRNEEVLRTVKLADGSNIFERVYKILSTDEFKRVSDNQNLKFSQRFKKDLNKAVRDLKFSNSILADDQRTPTIDGNQSLNVLWLQNTYTYIEDYSKTTPESRALLKFPPTSERSWAFERNKLAWVLGIILEARDLKKEKGISLRDAMLSLSRDHDGNPIDRESPEHYHFYLRGIEKMSKINPQWQKVPLPSKENHVSCAANVVRIARP